VHDKALKETLERIISYNWRKFEQEWWRGRMETGYLLIQG